MHHTHLQSNTYRYNNNNNSNNFITDITVLHNWFFHLTKCISTLLGALVAIIFSVNRTHFHWGYDIWCSIKFSKSKEHSLHLTEFFQLWPFCSTSAGLTQSTDIHRANNVINCEQSTKILLEHISEEGPVTTYLTKQPLFFSRKWCVLLIRICSSSELNKS